MTAVTNNPADSWIAMPRDSDFPIQNLPYGVFRHKSAGPRIGVAIGDYVVDLAALHEAGLFGSTSIADDNLFARDALNPFMARGHQAWDAVRGRIIELLKADNPELRDNRRLREAAIIVRDGVQMLLPAAIGDFVDFYSSREHATNAGTLFRGAQNALPPNWLYLPIAYHGRAGSIVVSPQDIRRPHGQIRPNPDAPPILAPSRRLDFELELGFLAGVGNRAGVPISTGEADKHIFGAVLLNDWSARRSAMGISAARSFSRQIVRHHDLAVGGAIRSPEAISGDWAASGSAGAGLPPLQGRLEFRYQS